MNNKQVELNVNAIRVGRDRLVLLGTPAKEDQTMEGWHNCDYMGCGRRHVVARAVILRIDGDPEDWNRSAAMLRILASVHGYELVSKADSEYLSDVNHRTFRYSLLGRMTCTEHDHENSRGKVDMDINEKLAQLAHELQTQDNRHTADPIYLVQQKVAVWGMDLEYADEKYWEGEGYERPVPRSVALAEMGADEDVTDDDIEDWGFAPVGVVWRWEYVTAHFTERAAKEFIEHNGHRYADGLRVYVDSQYRCPEWQMVIDHLRTLAPRADSE